MTMPKSSNVSLVESAAFTALIRASIAYSYALGAHMMVPCEPPRVAIWVAFFSGCQRYRCRQVNTDSNTRQRDNCEMDAFITAMGQFSISTSVRLQRRTFEFAMRNGYNMQCAHATKHP